MSPDSADAAAGAVATLLRDKERGKGNGTCWSAARRTKFQHRKTRRKGAGTLYLIIDWMIKLSS